MAKSVQIQKTENYYLRIIAFCVLNIALLVVAEKINQEKNQIGKSLWSEIYNDLANYLTEL